MSKVHRYTLVHSPSPDRYTNLIKKVSWRDTFVDPLYPAIFLQLVSFSCLVLIHQLIGN